MWQGGIKVIFVSDWLTHLISVTTDFTDVTLVPGEKVYPRKWRWRWNWSSWLGIYTVMILTVVIWLKEKMMANLANVGLQGLSLCWASCSSHRFPSLPSRSGSENRNPRWRQIKDISQTDKGELQENIHHKSEMEEYGIMGWLEVWWSSRHRIPLGGFGLFGLALLRPLQPVGAQTVWPTIGYVP